jgi:hypothetical protein
MSLEGLCYELDTKSYYKLTTSLQEAGCDRIFREKSSLQIGYKNVMSLK